MPLHTRYFTLAEARSVLQSILPDLSRIAELKKTLDSRNYDVYRHRYFGGAGPNGSGAYPPELDELVELVRTLTERGVMVKGLENGLIDFPHLRENGDEVYLCFKLGEEDILFWHPVDAGYAGRRSTTEL